MSSCQRDEFDNMDPTTVDTNDPQIVVVGNVVGKITNENGVPIEDALVLFAGDTRTTNELGLFEFIDIDFDEQGSQIVVRKDGFFDGSRRVYPEVGEKTVVQIQMITETLRGTINTTNGGAVDFGGGSNISLPEGVYQKESGGTYTGEVQVLGQWLDPSQPSTYLQMPGDLTGVDTEGETMALASYGMIKVELTDNAGNALQLPEGTTSTIELPVPEELQGNAPSTIPLWHFNEESGIWEEEGAATLQNGVYVGEVSHFSFWNCDVPFPLITLEGFVTADGSPLEDTQIKITFVANGTCSYGWTGQRGYFNGKVPKDEELLIHLLDPCGEPFHTESIGPFSEDEIIVVDIEPLEEDLITVSGNVVDCDGQPVTDGYVVVWLGASQFVLSLEDGEPFEFIIPYCDASTVTIHAVDLVNELASEPLELPVESNISAGTITSCSEIQSPGLYIDYNGKNWDMGKDSLIGYSYEVDTLIMQTGTRIILNLYMIDWTIFDVNLNNYVLHATFDYMDGEATGEYTARYVSQGFEVLEEGCQIQYLNLPEGMFIRFIDIGENIIVTDDSLYPGAVDEVTMDLYVQPF